MAREGTKRQTAIEIMNKNYRKKMADVVEMISKANDLKPGAARGYYVYLTKMGMAKGKIVPGTRGRKMKPINLGKKRSKKS